MRRPGPVRRRDHAWSVAAGVLLHHVAVLAVGTALAVQLLQARSR